MGHSAQGKQVLFMDKRIIINYCSAIAQCRRMIKMNIISIQEFEKMDRMLLIKYNLPQKSLFRDKTLLNEKSKGEVKK